MQAPIVYYTMQCWYINIINKEKNELSQSHWCQCQAFFLIKANKHYLYVNISVFQIKTFVIPKKGILYLFVLLSDILIPTSACASSRTKMFTVHLYQ